MEPGDQQRRSPEEDTQRVKNMIQIRILKGRSVLLILTSVNQSPNNSTMKLSSHL